MITSRDIDEQGRATGKTTRHAPTPLDPSAVEAARLRQILDHDARSDDSLAPVGAPAPRPATKPQRPAPPAVRPGDPPPGHETGVMEAETVAGGAIWVVRLLSVGLMAMTLLGTYVPFAGGWAAFVAAPWPPRPVAAGLAVATQAALTIAQWSFKAQAVRWWRRRARYGEAALRSSALWWGGYVLALLISAGLSGYTYGMWVGPALARLGPTWAGLIIVGIGAIIVDMVPEWVLIRS